MVQGVGNGKDLFDVAAGRSNVRELGDSTICSVAELGGISTNRPTSSPPLQTVVVSSLTIDWPA